ncbi:response regulator [Polaromonas sp. SM01]|uniref:response regulator n=1 Tax=Polaromonas sp. SM01 TaxID=3085630 RepID=UPI0029812DD1|nr:response regulator [Polaromonas sp. SM01]MDW5444276.1 response regulator [Polaromonas sp. SM01]
MKRIFVKHYGFSETERHALDTVFRLSESRETVYSAWTPETTDAPEVLLIDGDSWEAVLALANPAHDDLKLVWVGDAAPGQAWRVFPSPVKWSTLIETLDEEFAPLNSHSLSLDLDLVHAEDLEVHFDEADDTERQELAPAVPERRVLVVDAGRDERLYWRAKLAAAGLYEVDEAASGAEALALLREQPYHLVTVDLGLADMDSWQLIKAVEATRPAVPHLFVTGSELVWHQGVRAWFSGARVSLKKPLHPGQLKALLQHI